MRAGFIWLLGPASSRFSKWVDELLESAPRVSRGRHAGMVSASGGRPGGKCEESGWSTLPYAVCVWSARRTVVWVTSMNIRGEVKMWIAVCDVCVTYIIMHFCACVHGLIDKYDYMIWLISIWLQLTIISITDSSADYFLDLKMHHSLLWVMSWSKTYFIFIPRAI